MKTPLQTFTYEHPWEVVVEAYLGRYPTHPRLPVILETNVLADSHPSYDAIEGVTSGDMLLDAKREIQRRCTVDVEAPSWIKRTFKITYFYFMQKTEICYKTRSMIIINRNETMSEKVTMYDWCEYRQHHDNPRWTYFEQYAILELPKFPLSSTCEGLICKSYDKNTATGRVTDVAFISDVMKEVEAGQRPRLTEDMEAGLVQQTLVHAAKGRTRKEPGSQPDVAMSHAKGRPQKSLRRGHHSRSKAAQQGNQLPRLRGPTPMPSDQQRPSLFVYMTGICIILVLPQALHNVFGLLSVGPTNYTQLLTFMDTGMAYTTGVVLAFAWSLFCQIYKPDLFVQDTSAAENASVTESQSHHRAIHNVTGAKAPSTLPPNTSIPLKQPSNPATAPPSMKKVSDVEERDESDDDTLDSEEEIGISSASFDDNEDLNCNEDGNDEESLTEDDENMDGNPLVEGADPLDTTSPSNQRSTSRAIAGTTLLAAKKAGSGVVMAAKFIGRPTLGLGRRVTSRLRRKRGTSDEAAMSSNTSLAFVLNEDERHLMEGSSASAVDPAILEGRAIDPVTATVDAFGFIREDIALLMQTMDLRTQSNRLLMTVPGIVQRCLGDAKWYNLFVIHVSVYPSDTQGTPSPPTKHYVLEKTWDDVVELDKLLLPSLTQQSPSAPDTGRGMLKSVRLTRRQRKSSQREANTGGRVLMTSDKNGEKGEFMNFTMLERQRRLLQSYLTDILGFQSHAVDAASSTNNVRLEDDASVPFNEEEETIVKHFLCTNAYDYRLSPYHSMGMADMNEARTMESLDVAPKSPLTPHGTTLENVRMKTSSSLGHIDSSNAPKVPSGTIRRASILLKARWQTCFRDTLVTLDDVQVSVYDQGHDKRLFRDFFRNNLMQQSKPSSTGPSSALSDGEGPSARIGRSPIPTRPRSASDDAIPLAPPPRSPSFPRTGSSSSVGRLIEKLQPRVIQVKDVRQVICLTENGACVSPTSKPSLVPPSHQRGPLTDDVTLSLPFHDESHYFFVIVLANGEQHYFAAQSKAERDAWVQDLGRYVSSNSQSLKDLGATSLESPSPPISASKSSIDHMLARSGGRYVMNKSVFYFTPLPRLHPCCLAAELLLEAMELFQLYTQNKFIQTIDVQERLRTFQRRACQLQACASLPIMSEMEKMGFFINVYHTLSIHASITLGRPSSARSKKHLLMNVSYNIDGYVYSIAELEHAVLRGPLSRAHILNGQLTTPKFSKTDPRLFHAPLMRGDVRVNFVLNAGTQSSISQVFLFLPSKAERSMLGGGNAHDATFDRLMEKCCASGMEAQLTYVAGHFLNEQVQVHVARREIILPRICQWYSRDFGGGPRQDILKAMVPWFPKELKAAVRGLVTTTDGRASATSMLDMAEGPASMQLDTLPVASNNSTDNLFMDGRKLNFKVKFSSYDWSNRGVYFLGEPAKD